LSSRLWLSGLRKVPESRCFFDVVEARGWIMKRLIAQFVRDEQGQDLIEYALLAGFIALAVVTVVTNIGTSLNTLYTNVNTNVDNASKAGS